LVKFNQVRIELIAQIGNHALAQQGHEEKPRGSRQGQGEGDHKQQTERGIDLAAAAESLVDHIAHRDRQA